MWGTTYWGGGYGNGTIFKINKTTKTLTKAADIIGGNTVAGLVSDGSGNLWGTTHNGGAGGNGTVFKINRETNMLTTVLEFTGNGSQVNNGAGPGVGTMIRHTDANIYGTTASGGPGDMGTIFRMRFGPSPLTQAAGNVSSAGATLNGSVNPNNDGVTTVRFEYGTSPTMAGAVTTVATVLPNSNTAGAVEATIGSLASGTSYFFWTTAANAGITVTQQGNILSFTTAAPVVSSNLSALSLSAGILTPVFDGATTAYTAIVPHFNEAVTVTPVTESPSSTIRVRINGGSYLFVASGSTSEALDLENGPNPIDVEVTASDSTIKTYTAVVTRRIDINRLARSLTPPPCRAQDSG